MKPTRLPPPHRHRATPRFGVARVLSKRGVCSRTQAQALVRDGRVAVNGRRGSRSGISGRCRRAAIALDGKTVAAAEKVYIALNKPRGAVTTASDERDRTTVYDVLRDAGFVLDAWIAPVGRLDKASEGLLLLSNDSAWAAALTDPASHLDKTYHVQIDALPDAAAAEEIARRRGRRRRSARGEIDRGVAQRRKERVARNRARRRPQPAHPQVARRRTASACCG